MRCPRCGQNPTRTLETRGRLKDSVMRRKRWCMNCSLSWYTVEHAEALIVATKEALAEAMQMLMGKNGDSNGS